jgi:hypothetical protein
MGYHSREGDSLHSLRRWPEDKNGMISPDNDKQKLPVSLLTCVNESHGSCPIPRQFFMLRLSDVIKSHVPFVEGKCLFAQT